MKSKGMWIPKNTNFERPEKVWYLKVLNLLFQDKRETLFFDNGCSKHMTGNKELLINLKHVNGLKVIFGGNEKDGWTKGLGELHIDGLIIKDVAYVDGLKFNLLTKS